MDLPRFNKLPFTEHIFSKMFPFLKKDFIYLFMRHTHTHTEREREREREREAETLAEGEVGSMQGARCGTRSGNSSITLWAKGRR